MEYKFFTIEEANSLIPELKYMLTLMNLGKDQLVEAILEVEHLKRKIGFNGNRRAMEKKLNDIMRYSGRVASVHKSIMGKGIVVRDYEEGVVDFPSIVNGEPGYLCWNSEEEKVNHWHKVEDGERFLIDKDTRVLHLTSGENDMSEN